MITLYTYTLFLATPRRHGEERDSAPSKHSFPSEPLGHTYIIHVADDRIREGEKSKFRLGLCSPWLPVTVLYFTGAGPSVP